MAIIKTKGTVIQATIATVLTSLAQVISITKAEDKNEIHDADYLDNASAGILQAGTGRTAIGGISGELFYDPTAATHIFLIGLLSTPANNAGKIVLADSGTSGITYTSCGVGFGFTVALGDGLKAPFSIDLADLPVYPTGS